MNILVELIRYETSDEGTFGKLFIEGDFFCHTIELPWRNNKRNYSCIPPAIYEAHLIFSQKFGFVYHIKSVPGRSGILIHSGNVAGDRTKGYKSHSYGCILLGKKKGYLWGQKAVLVSRPIIAKFRETLKRLPIQISIIDLTGTMNYEKT